MNTIIPNISFKNGQPSLLLQTPVPDAELTVAESLQRSRDRKKRRQDFCLMIEPKGTMDCVQNCLSSESCHKASKCLLNRMVATNLIDDFTEPSVVLCIAEHTPDWLSECVACKEGGGFDLIRNNIHPKKYTVVSDVLKSNYSSLSDPEEKCIYWTVSAAVLILYYEINSSNIFTLPLTSTRDEFEAFLIRYPEFILRTWDAAELLTFQICMKAVVSCFGNGNNMGCLTELVTRITKGRDVALTCNTSGGGLRNYDHPTEVSTEKCRILMYQRESGILPRTRKTRGSKRKFSPDGSVMAMPGIPMVRGINGPRNPPDEVIAPIRMMPHTSMVASSSAFGPQYMQPHMPHLASINYPYSTPHAKIYDPMHDVQRLPPDSNYGQFGMNNSYSTSYVHHSPMMMPSSSAYDAMAMYPCYDQSMRPSSSMLAYDGVGKGMSQFPASMARYHGSEGVEGMPYRGIIER